MGWLFWGAMMCLSKLLVQEIVGFFPLVHWVPQSLTFIWFHWCWFNEYEECIGLFMVMYKCFYLFVMYVYVYICVFYLCIYIYEYIIHTCICAYVCIYLTFIYSFTTIYVYIVRDHFHDVISLKQIINIVIEIYK